MISTLEHSLLQNRFQEKRREVVNLPLFYLQAFYIVRLYFFLRKNLSGFYLAELVCLYMNKGLDYDNWNHLKKDISKRSRVFFNKGEIWFTSLGKNIGDEEDGKNEYFERPVLIIRRFNNNVFLAVPLTSQEKEGKFYHKLASLNGSTVILSQLRLLDAKRLLRFMGKISNEEVVLIKEIIRRLI